MQAADDLPLPGALRRVLPAIGGAATLERLSELSGSDFTTVMLEVARRRAARETPASVLRRYREDRFVRPGAVSWHALRAAEDALLGCLPAAVDRVVLAPLAPLGAHSALGTVSQHKVVTALRACEVAADPTNALALEAAARRAAGHPGPVRLAGLQRVVRAQHVSGSGMFAHFTLFGMVTAGRDRGGAFAREAVAEQVRWAASGLAAAGLPMVQLALTPLSDAGRRIMAGLAEALVSAPVDIVADERRRSGRGYYTDLCFKLNVRAGDGFAEVGDGGFVDWGARLAADARQRLLISGIGVDRVAALADRAAVPAEGSTADGDRA